MDFLQLRDKWILVTGLANRKSVAWHVGQVLQQAGARVIYSVHTPQRRAQVQRWIGRTPVEVCDVQVQDQIEGLARAVARHTDVLHGLVHSIASADYAGVARPFHELTRQQFLRAMDVSCYSLVALADAMRPLLARDGSVVAMSISTTRMASQSYGVMGPVKAALNASLAFLARSFSTFSQVRFNAVGAGPLKTAASAGIPGYADAYMYAEKVIPRGRGVTTQEVANVAAFLLSPRSAGINAQVLVVDAGMEINYFDPQIIRRVVAPDAG